MISADAHRLPFIPASPNQLKVRASCTEKLKAES